MADALASGASARKGVGVQLPPLAFHVSILPLHFSSFWCAWVPVFAVGTLWPKPKPPCGKSWLLPKPPRAKSASVPVWVPVARAGLWFWSPAEKGFDAGRPCCGRHGLPRCSSVHGQGGSRDVSPAAPNLLPNPAYRRSLGAGGRLCLRACSTSNNQQSVRCKHAAPGVGYGFRLARYSQPESYGGIPRIPQFFWHLDRSNTQ